MDTTGQQYLHDVCRLCCCDESNTLMISLDNSINFETPDRSSVELDLVTLVHYCVDLHLTDLDADFPNNPKVICIDCVNKIKAFYKFKEFCRNNNELYFMCESVVEMVNETTVTEELIESSVDISTLKQEDDSQFLSTTIGYGEAHPISYEEVMMNEKKTLRKSKISSKNAERQKLKRMLETPEEKEIRRQKNAEQTKLRRERLRQENPEKYAEILRNVAERKRIKRMTMSEQEKQELRMKEATSARYRRNLLSPEKKEIYKQRNRDSARARRTKKPNFDVKEEIDDTCSSQEIYYIEQV